MLLVKSKTPKVTLYTKFAKCMLMENTPNADLEVCFYDGERHRSSQRSERCIRFSLKHSFFPPLGAKTHKTSEQVRLVEKSGKSYTMKGDVGLSGLSPECRVYMELSEEVMHYFIRGCMFKCEILHV